jgi:acyl transferase domain-containing protein
MAVRAPGGVAGLDAYWDAVLLGRELLRDLPEDRRGEFGDGWDAMVTRAGYLDAPFDFDAGFFGIAPKEARVLDPQHRILLETVWEAFEHAAIPAAAVAESTGVFVGITGLDYRQWLTGEPNSYWTVGNGHSFAAGRVAFTLGLQGPVFALDTACSSSLVAVHTACRALGAGDCDAAIAAGVNLILAPSTTWSVERTGALSPHGTSRPFDAAADGFVRGEGCGAVLLKRLEDAVRDQDRILAVIRGTGINHDGRTPAFTAPNVDAQARLIGSVLAASGVAPEEIGYHEAHGTGTPLGDPSEMRALTKALGRRSGRPLYVASVKGNVGHTEAAAGVLGLIKAVLCLRHRTIAPQAGFRSLNPRIEVAGTGIEIAAEARPWDERLGPYASTSSYGMSGTNAFALLAPAPPSVLEPSVAARTPTGFPISAATRPALAAVAARYAEHLAKLPEQEFPAFAGTAALGRARLKHAAWVGAAGPRAAASALAGFAAGGEDPAVRPLAPDEGEWPDGPRGVPATLPSYPWQRLTYRPGVSGAR